MSDDEPIYLDIGDLAGVDASTYAAADSGDRQAQKLMLRNLLTSQAGDEVTACPEYKVTAVRVERAA